MYLSDRARVELMLPAYMMYTVMVDGVDKEKQDSDEFKAITKNMVLAGQEPIADLDPKKGRKIMNRVDRLNVHCHNAYVDEGIEVAKVGLIFFHVLRMIIESGYLQYPEGSAIDLALQAFMGALDDHAAIEALNKSAQKQARKLLLDLQQQGFYQGVPTE